MIFHNQYVRGNNQTDWIFTMKTHETKLVNAHTHRFQIFINQLSQNERASLVAQRLKRLLAMQETWVRSLGRIGFTRLIPRYRIFIHIMTCVYTLVFFFFYVMKKFLFFKELSHKILEHLFEV